MEYKIFIVCYFIFNWGWAQQDSMVTIQPLPPDVIEDVVEVEEEYQTIRILSDSVLWNDTIQPAKFEDDFQQKYHTPDFDYSLTKPKESLWSKFKRKLSELFAKFFRVDDVASISNFLTWMVRLIAVVIVALVAYWLLKYFIGREGNSFFSKKDKSINPEAKTIQENIHEIDFNKLIQSYELNNDYRYAVRYQYLHILKLLNDKSLLTWDPEKTNLDYVNELSDTGLKPSFKQLTHIFDYVWYGEFLVDQESYEKIRAQFNTLKQKV